VNTGVARTIAEHPIGMLRRLQFRVTVNTDNRLMSNTTMTNAMKSAFAPFPERLRLINGIIKPRYSVLKSESDLGS